VPETCEEDFLQAFFQANHFSFLSARGNCAATASETASTLVATGKFTGFKIVPNLE
jgi:hypothetical protein